MEQTPAAWKLADSSRKKAASPPNRDSIDRSLQDWTITGDLGPAANGPLWLAHPPADGGGRLDPFGLFAAVVTMMHLKGGGCCVLGGHGVSLALEFAVVNDARFQWTPFHRQNAPSMAAVPMLAYHLTRCGGSLRLVGQQRLPEEEP